MLVTACPAWGGIIYVDDSATGANNGSSWEDAYASLQPALAAAQDGDAIWVAAGTYVGPFTLTSGVAVYGGFAGSESQLDQRDWVANTTILDGNASGSVVTAPAWVFTCTRIDGFTIRNGTSGGIDCAFFDRLTISNNAITGNSGGGIYCATPSLPTISNNTITGNSGGGIYCSNSSPTISNNTIAGNSGDGIYCANSSLPTISSNTIAGNTGVGINCFNGSSPRISNNTITGNNYYGIYTTSSMMVSNNTITGNNGCGIYWEFCGGGAVNNTITGNNGSGICCVMSVSSMIANNTIAGNNGSGIYCVMSRSTISNNIVAFNSSGLYDSDRGATLRNNCVFNPGGSNYSGLSPGTGDISSDPNFVRNSDPGGDGIWGTADDDYGDLHLQAGSPCIDAGDNAISWRLAAFDLDGRYRILNCRVDMGAYEFARHELLPEEAPTLCHVITRITGGELDLHLPREGGSESRSGTLSKVILLFSEPVQAVDGVPDATELSLSGATLGSVTTTGPEMALTVSGVSDESCLGITVAGLADLTGNLLAGDSGAHIRVLAGDGNMSGNITLADALLAKSKIGQPVTLYPHLDYNLSGGISLADALYAKGRIGKQALCP